MADLCLGCIDVPYDNRDGQPATTYTVATILEEKYGVMRNFYEAHQQDITKALVSSVESALSAILEGGFVGDPLASAGQDIRQEFRTFLMTGEIEGMGIPGVPTKAGAKPSFAAI